MGHLTKRARSALIHGVSVLKTDLATFPKVNLGKHVWVFYCMTLRMKTLAYRGEFWNGVLLASFLKYSQSYMPQITRWATFADAIYLQLGMPCRFISFWMWVHSIVFWKMCRPISSFLTRIRLYGRCGVTRFWMPLVSFAETVFLEAGKSDLFVRMWFLRKRTSFSVRSGPNMMAWSIKKTKASTLYKKKNVSGSNRRLEGRPKSANWLLCGFP